MLLDHIFQLSKQTILKRICHAMATKLVSFTFVLLLILTSSCFVSAFRCYECYEYEPNIDCSVPAEWKKVECDNVCVVVGSMIKEESYKISVIYIASKSV